MVQKDIYFSRELTEGESQIVKKEGKPGVELWSEVEIKLRAADQGLEPDLYKISQLGSQLDQC